MTWLQSPVRRAVNAAVLFIALMFFAGFGRVGLLLGRALVAIAKVILDRVEPASEPAGELLGH